MLRACRVTARVTARVISSCAVAAVSITTLSLSAGASPSPDPDAPRLWSAWQSDGTAWLAASPADVPPDGAVLGWRYSLPADGASGDSPGGELPDFAKVCGGKAAPAGHKRVAVTADYGDAETDARPGQTPPAQPLLACAVTPADATAVQVLAAVARTRVDGRDAVVAVNGYPAGTQGTDLAAPAAAGGSSTEGTPLPWILGGAGALALVAGGAVAATRRRRASV
ncbi:SCO2322 family protein [Thermoactinospora rubra]|uniref:SCO2322 family protein n=1 Tax=Thermoactinospora rubra TaxID=1088767 RepID=UPI000A0F9465|nr:SCO2322 family protein [Thermoactinospora rubra]